MTDNIHGDIELSADEWKVVNTATFQRLRSLKQLGMGHLVYPNATHTRFAHSLGVFRIMCRVLEKLDQRKLRGEKADLRLAALLHDIGHYPYSHLMERIDKVILTEHEVDIGGKLEISGKSSPYPDHEELGRHILLKQKDIRSAIGSTERAKKIGYLFSRMQEADQQLSKLIHSSLDMDRLDYLLRDSKAAGVPYGEIDLNYLLNNIRISPKGLLGVDEKSLAAAEHFLLARVFMHRVVYYHKTTYGFEEACRQLLRRVRDSRRYAEDLAGDRRGVLDICGGTALHGFTDDYIDRIVFKAVGDEDPIINILANCIAGRRPPRLLAEVGGVVSHSNAYTAGKFFKERCRDKLPSLAAKYGLRLEQFLLCGPKPIKFEERGSLFSQGEAAKLIRPDREELILLFRRNEKEPRSIVDFEGSIIHTLSNQVFSIQRLHVAALDMSDFAVQKLRDEIAPWTKPPA